jgi:5'-3' exonuclease
MGVPGFFRYLVKKHKNIIKGNPEKEIKALYIDANCLFHPQCFKVLEKHKHVRDQERLFKLMTKQIIGYLDYIIDLVNPTDLVYIAVDGVAPLAKINQQRSRRFGYANNYKHKIYKKYNIPINDSWSNIVITPGTDFMFNLHNIIKKYYTKKIKNNKEDKRKYSIIYDSYLTEGEGEHKILQHIKSFIKSNEKNATVIYGLDADLIFLTMSSQCPNLFLLRESDQFNMISNTDIEEELLYVDIDLSKKYINDLFTSYYLEEIEGVSGVSESFNLDFTNDYVFICYFLGNDFLPHLPSIDIKMNGLDIIQECYIETFCNLGKNIISFKDNKVFIDNDFLISFISSLAHREETFFKDEQPYLLERFKRRRCFETEQHKKEIWEIENLKNVIVEDKIKLGFGNSDEWKYRYYSHYFNTQEYVEETIDDVCHNYLEGILWVTKYYFEKCPSWRWQYKYTHAPFLSDILQYIKKKNIMKDFNIMFQKPVGIYTQLVSVIPSAYNNILPEPLRYLNSSYKSPIIDMYPLTYELDMINKTQLYKCIPIIPYLDLDRIIDIVNKIKLNKTDLERVKRSNYFNLGSFG